MYKRATGKNESNGMSVNGEKQLLIIQSLPKKTEHKLQPYYGSALPLSL